MLKAINMQLPLILQKNEQNNIKLYKMQRNKARSKLYWIYNYT